MKHDGAPILFTTPPWSRQDIDEVLKRGPHKSKSCNEHIDFLEEDFIDTRSLANKLLDFMLVND